MSPGETLLWRGGELASSPAESTAPMAPTASRADRPTASPPDVLVADSWLVLDGAVRALDVHRDRFTSSVAATGLVADDDDVEAFWGAVVDRLPRDGAWFPRVELVRDSAAGAPELRARLRTAPDRTRSVRVATAARDPRTSPLVKGPDLAALGDVRSEAASRGAEEAVILSPEGHVVEGAWSSLVWWRGDSLCTPADDLPRLPGVTSRTVLTLAAVLGVDVLHDRSTPAELDGAEIWSLSALHGVRIVSGWVDGPSPAEQPGRLATWQARLDALRRPLPARS
ncbi:aminotransferase class IV [Frigoribacterium sp. VKM Ac-2530]|uniref:aminotransferase class IV n=1 Tax=Frigoribacterium sp. VKM Ac-2530 TaxID=2783822 RepID=UPI00188B45A5|nr:aminotransferase class IV [Frigoribacterium sp. VKM Ac-2530]MBF4578493.1 aminotransferase class IV [Frigoribacterium sp. VKM Ac-2530]